MHFVCRVRYDEKADMYSLGIIFFEMWQPKFDTYMERSSTIAALRANPDKVLAERMPKNVGSAVKIISCVVLAPGLHLPVLVVVGCCVACTGGGGDGDGDGGGGGGGAIRCPTY